jgi:hypothetical protein
MSGTIQTASSARVVADYVIGYGDKGEHVLEYQGEFFFENGEVLKDKAVAEQLPEPFKKRALEFVAKAPAAPAPAPAPTSASTRPVG